MKYKPAVVSAKQLKKFEAARHRAALVGDIVTAGITKYKFLLLVFAENVADPVLIVSSEYFAGGADTILGIFDEPGHQTLHGDGLGWSDETKFTTRALELANERLKIDLK